MSHSVTQTHTHTHTHTPWPTHSLTGLTHEQYEPTLKALTKGKRETICNIRAFPFGKAMNQRMTGEDDSHYLGKSATKRRVMLLHTYIVTTVGFGFVIHTCGV